MPLRRLRTSPLLLVAVLGWLIPSAHADPGPDNPSEEDISAAYTAVESTAARVGRLEAELARANGELEALRVDAAKAVEAYNGAVVVLAEVTEEAVALRNEAAEAAVQLAESREVLGRFAADTYRSGGPLAAATMVLDAKGPQGLLDRLNVIDAIAGEFGAAYDRHDAAEIAARVIATGAGNAQAVQEEHAAAAEAARAAAQRAAGRPASGRAGRTSPPRRPRRRTRPPRPPGCSATRGSPPDRPPRPCRPGDVSR